MTIKQEYMKERKRVQQFIRRAEKRGYSFDFEVPKIPKKITRSSINRLKKATPKQLYEKATYTIATGEKVSGRKGQQIERKKRTEKAKQTRAQKEQAKREYASEQFFEDYGTYEPPVSITSGEIAVQNLERMIQEAYEQGNENSARLIENVLNREIATKERILIQDGFMGDAHQEARNIIGFAMENAPEDWVECANVVFHYKMYTGTWQRAYTTLINIITGTIPTAQEQNYYQSEMQKDVEWVDDE